MGTREQVSQSSLSNKGGRSKTFIHLALNGNISPENMGMDMMVLKV